MSAQIPDPLAQSIKARLDAEADGLDPVTVARLAAARRRALAEVGPRGAPSRQAIRRWTPALAALALAALGLALLRPPAAVPMAAAPSPEALEFLGLEAAAGPSTPEVLADLDFYEWLAAGGPDAT
jgi:hypothetical protein